MSKKVNMDQKTASGTLREADKSSLFSKPATAKSLAKREAVVRADEQAVLSREEKTSIREKVISQREETADKRDTEVRADEQAILSTEAETILREKVVDLREESADKREKLLRNKNKTTSFKDKLSMNTHALLREANERLVVATVHAQTMTETAELATEQMSYLAEHDFLTGLPNRALLTDRLAQSIALAQRHGKKVALMYLDLDHFKHINDSFGHAVGDLLLQSVAKRLQNCVRNSDTVSRQGGDEFVVLLTEIEKVHDSVLAAEKIIEAMALPHFVNGNQLSVTFSIGISIYPDDGEDNETMVRNADTAMYQAKETGRNNYQIFIPEMKTSAVMRQFMEQELRNALEQNKFVLHYQPKINLETGAIAGAEALIRILETDDRLIYPEDFISIAENSGLILPIGKWVLNEACRQAKAWLQAGLDIGQIAVNVSSREFHSQGFLAGVISALNDTGLDPHYLELEMTESGLMEDTEPTMVTMYALKKLGVGIAIDDFGTGYSSLSYLMRFPLDTLKIDQSFVQKVDNTTGDTGDAGEAIISAIIAMGVSLKKRVVAEGVETQQQLAFLQSQNCAEGQGNYFSQAIPADEFASMLQAGKLT